jgi:malonyl-CoA/methylmalonyl-CoA synthetase
MQTDPLPGLDPLAWLERSMLRAPERLFLKSVDGRTVRYGDLEAASRCMAAALQGRGVLKGDRVTVAVEKSVEAIFLYVACLRIGAVYMPLNTAYTASELEYFLTDAGPRLMISSAALAGSSVRAAAARGGTQLLTLEADGTGELADLCAQSSEHAPAGVLQGGDLAALVYTSGTTGRSKGAMLTRANLGLGTQRLVDAWEFIPTDVLLHALPLFHVHGLFMALNTVLASGASLLFLPRFDAEELLRLLPQASVLMGVPTFYTRLLNHPGFTRESAATIRVFISGSAPLLPETHREFTARCGQAILERYGMTETMVIASNPLHAARKPGSVGPPLAGVEVRIAEVLEGGASLDGNRIGMIEVRGASVFKGYWNAPDKTAADHRDDGFFITGDLGYFDADGYLHIVGRAKDLIITGGFNVYPVEVEECIDALPGVAESAVIGLPHADFGEAVTAVVVGLEGSAFSEPEVLNALKEHLAKFKLPKRVLFVAELPRNAMGKVQKQALRTAHAGLYG